MDKCIFVFVFFFGIYLFGFTWLNIISVVYLLNVCISVEDIYQFPFAIHASISIIHVQNKFLTEPCYLFIEIKAHWSSSNHDECYMLYTVQYAQKR